MKTGWIGTGVMGASMAQRLRDAGHELFIFTRTREKARTLLDNGAAWCESPARLAEVVEILFTMVGLPADVEDVYFGDQGIFSRKIGCAVVVDMTTSKPSLARTIAKKAGESRIGCLDAPVSGGDIGARHGTLAIMVGGDEDIFNQVLPFFEVMGENISRMGGHGAGQHAKMCNQILVAGNIIGTCESLLYASAQGLDHQAVIDIIGKGAAGSWSINNLGPRIAQGDYGPGFYVEHFIKDMDIALHEAAAANIALPGLALVRQLFQAVKAQGHGRSGTQALFHALKTINAMD